MHGRITLGWLAGDVAKDRRTADCAGLVCRRHQSRARYPCRAAETVLSQTSVEKPSSRQKRKPVKKAAKRKAPAPSLVIVSKAPNDAPDFDYQNRIEEAQALAAKQPVLKDDMQFDGGGNLTHFVWTLVVARRAAADGGAHGRDREKCPGLHHHLADRQFHQYALQVTKPETPSSSPSAARSAPRPRIAAMRWASIPPTRPKWTQDHAGRRDGLPAPLAAPGL